MLRLLAAMKYRSCFTLMWISVVFRVATSQVCNSLKSGIPDVFCDCDSLDDSRGWSYTCFVNEPLEILILFTLEYRVSKDDKRTIKFDCGNNGTHYESILQQLNHTNIESYIFRSCPLPNVSFGGLVQSLDKNPLREIKIENTKDNRSFTADLFEPVSNNLKTLILTKNGIKELPENIFSNFSKLENLILSDNLLKTLPEKLLHPLPQLLGLELTNNLLESLPESVFEGLFQLKNLYMSKNKFKELPNTVFKSLLNLQVLDLADNHLMSMPPDIFLGLSQLKYVRLRGNWLRTLPKELFSYTLNVEEIDLSINRLMEPLPETLLHGLSRLQKFTIQECNITYIYETFFGSSAAITNLQLESNRLKQLPENIFSNNTKLKELNLNLNLIETVPENLLSNQKYLEKLSLSQNKITSIPKNFFKNTRSIKALFLGQNNIERFTQLMFKDLPNLETIDLSKNKLTSFMLDLNREIKYIGLSYNNISKMPPLQFTNHLKLETLDLQYNKITYFKIPVMYSGIKRSPSINVAHNNISTVDVYDVLVNDNHLPDLPANHYEDYVETIVSLNSNPFVCNCNLYAFFEYLKRSVEAPKKSVRFSMIKNLICNEPPVYRGTPILRMKAEDFSCDLKENCSSPCHCYYRVHDDSRIVNCSNHGRHTLPEVIPANTSVLYYQNNLLSDMSDFNKDTWTNLTQVYLDNNQISSIGNWNIPKNLKFVSLSGNRLRQLPESFINFTADKNEFRVNLSSNPWTCNCSTMNFKTWLAENFRTVLDAKDVLCSQRLKQNGSLDRISVLSIADDVMCPLNDWPYRVQMITVATVCAVLAISFVIVSVLYYKNKQTVIAYLYIHMHPFFICFFNEEDFDEDKIFDAFVAYGHDDCDVAHKLIEELEPHFQLCIHERNWIAGNQISWNIFNSVHNSRRTILVISKQFLESMWFQVEFHTAYYQMLEDKIDRLIIIVKGELPPKDTLDKELLYLLSTKTYLIWEERWFWEKLRYAMPHKNQQTLESNVLALKDKPDREKIKAVDNQIAILSANRATDKAQEVVQNGTNIALSLVSRDSATKR